MRKATLNPNPFVNAKQELQIEGFQYANRIIQRDSITQEVGQIDRPDKTVVSNGRVEPGEFSVTLDPADTLCREEFDKWMHMAIDKASSVSSAKGDQQLGADLYTYEYNNFQYGDINALSNDDGRVGIDGNYKRKAIITIYRLFKPSSSQFEEGGNRFGDQSPMRIYLSGVWCKSVEYPEFDLESDDASTFTCTLSYDDVYILR